MTISGPEATREWPEKFGVRFRATGGLQYRVSLALILVGLARSWKRRAVAILALLTSFAIGFLVAANVGSPWLIALPPVVLVGGVLSSIFNKTRISELYEPGSDCYVVIDKGIFAVKLNGTKLGQLVEHVVCIRYLLGLAAVEGNNGHFIVVPRRYMPHRPS